MRRRGRAFIIGIGIMMAAAALSGCGKKAEEAAVTTEAPTVMPEETKTIVLETEPTTEAETEPEGPEERKEVDGKIQSYLTGEMVDVAKANRRPVAVMMSNDKASLPQYGINRADVVYEAPVEGDMNRYMAIFEDYDDIERIGSVRSCRTYYTYFAREYDAIYAHYGQSTFAVPYLKNVDNINGVDGTGGNAFYRTKDKKAPHNAYTSGAKLNKTIGQLGYRTSYSDTYTGHFQFSKNTYVPAESDAKDAYKFYPSYTMNNPWFEYNAETKEYSRFQFNAPHIDQNTGNQLTCENIILQYSNYVPYDPNGYLNVDTQSGGEGKYITRGKAIDIHWTKDSQWGITHYYDSNNQEIQLNPGKTWVEIVLNNSVGSVSLQ